MPTQLVTLPLDGTGASPNNKVQGEQHTLSGNRVRSIAPAYGAFFADSVVIKDMSNNVPLVRDVDWYPGNLYEAPTSKFGAGIYGLIMIINQNVSNTITVDYQALGGEYSLSANAVSQLVNNLAIDARPVAWPDIVRKPSAYPPSPHLHSAGDLFGFEYMVQSLERLRQTIAFGDQVGMDQLLAYVDSRFNQLALAISQASEITIDLEYWDKKRG